MWQKVNTTPHSRVLITSFCRWIAILCSDDTYSSHCQLDFLGCLHVQNLSAILHYDVNETKRLLRHIAVVTNKHNMMHCFSQTIPAKCRIVNITIITLPSHGNAYSYLQLQCNHDMIFMASCCSWPVLTVKRKGYHYTYSQHESCASDAITSNNFTLFTNSIQHCVYTYVFTQASAKIYLLTPFPTATKLSLCQKILSYVHLTQY